MTTKAAERLYEAQHQYEWGDRGWAVYNPEGKPEDELPTIFGFNNGGQHGWMSAALIAEDGTGLGGHCCTSEGYMPHDLGVLNGARPDRHETFRKHYPDGYRMEFVGYSSVQGHAKLMAAIEISNAKAANEGEYPSRERSDFSGEQPQHLTQRTIQWNHKKTQIVRPLQAVVQG